jgi:type I site-specific restriction endonuclease
VEEDYLAAEARARVNIDSQLRAAGWIVQDYKRAAVNAGKGVAVREFILEKPHGRVDYLPFIGGQPAGVIEDKPEGTTLTEVEHQSGKYVEGLPACLPPPPSSTNPPTPRPSSLKAPTRTTAAALWKAGCWRVTN